MPKLGHLSGRLFVLEALDKVRATDEISAEEMQLSRSFFHGLDSVVTVVPDLDSITPLKILQTTGAMRSGTAALLVFICMPRGPVAFIEVMS